MYDSTVCHPRAPFMNLVNYALVCNRVRKSGKSTCNMQNKISCAGSNEKCASRWYAAHIRPHKDHAAINCACYQFHEFVFASRVSLRKCEHHISILRRNPEDALFRDCTDRITRPLSMRHFEMSDIKFCLKPGPESPVPFE